MAANVPYKCKHLCMLRFRVVSPSLTTNNIHIAFSRLYNQSNNVIAVV